MLCLGCNNLTFLRLQKLNWRRYFLKEHICFYTAGVSNVICCVVLGMHFRFFLKKKLFKSCLVASRNISGRCL